MRLSLLALAPVVLVFGQGCGASLAQPFDQMKAAPITVFRLQNYEPPQAQTQTAQLQLPPQIQQLITAGASLLPPGLVPPGLLPGSQVQPATADAARFHGFRILGWKQVPTQSVHDEVLDILGHDANFVVPHDGCMYAEFGVSIAQNAPQAADVLISLSCEQVQPFGFNWPYAKNGVSPATAKRVVAVMQSTFGG